MLRQIESGSSAKMAGMQEGELLLEVNGEPVEPLTHEEIVDRVRLSGHQVSLTTITLKGMDFYTQVGIASQIGFSFEKYMNSNDQAGIKIRINLFALSCSWACHLFSSVRMVLRVKRRAAYQPLQQSSRHKRKWMLFLSRRKTWKTMKYHICERQTF